MKYELEWQYADNPTNWRETEPYTHFVFMLRFPDTPPGKGHAVHFCFNVVRDSEPQTRGISVLRRGFLVSIPFEEWNIKRFVESSVSEAFRERTRDDALDLLNASFINSDVDFSHEFADDLIEREELLVLIKEAFDGVTRGDGITLHQAIVIDDYGTEEQFVDAKKRDTEERWQDVPTLALIENPQFMIFLDSAGFRYYLPAAMSWAVKNFDNDKDDNGFFFYMAVLPTVAPREAGRGLGAVFDLDAFIDEYMFSPTQVNAIYRFICFMAIQADLGMDEDQYAAIKKWRHASKAG